MSREIPTSCGVYYFDLRVDTEWAKINCKLVVILPRNLEYSLTVRFKSRIVAIVICLMLNKTKIAVTVTRRCFSVRAIFMSMRRLYKEFRFILKQAHNGTVTLTLPVSLSLSLSLSLSQSHTHAHTHRERERERESSARVNTLVSWWDIYMIYCQYTEDRTNQFTQTPS